MSKWSNFYSTKCNKTYVDYLRNQYSPFLKLINQAAPCGKRIAEMGCGTGSITKILMESAPSNSYHILDRDPEMLNIATSNALGATSELGSILDSITDTYDIIHSHGVLEHFDMEDVRKIIKLQLESANTLIHYVPGSLHKTPSFGDERLVTLNEWIKETAPNQVLTFNSDHDYILIWENKCLA